MNIPLLRRVQLSIADESKPFDMSCWYSCIGAHTCWARRETGLESESPNGLACAEYLGLTRKQADSLFGGQFAPVTPLGAITRSQAIAAIDQLIAEGSTPVPSRKARSRVPAQETTKAEEETQELVAV